MIPLKLETLLAGRTVEQNRVEYKEDGILMTLSIRSVHLQMIFIM